MKDSKTVVIIPARMDSKRLPGKPLKQVGDWSLLKWTYEQARKVCPSRTIVASSDEAVLAHCRVFGMDWIGTRDHPTGTHRVAEAADKLIGEWDAVVNWQVDEPLVQPADAMKAIKLARSGKIGTLFAHLSPKDRRNTDIVKVKIEAGFHDGGELLNCYWFSRVPTTSVWGHVGIYAFSREVLDELSRLEPTRKSREESLEQLAWMEAGHKIFGEEVDEMPLSINSQGDLEKFEEIACAEVH